MLNRPFRLSRRSVRRVLSSAAGAHTCEPLELRRMLCSSPLSLLPPAPKWSDAIEQDFQRKHAGRGGPESVGIVWTNRNTFSGANDNFFDDVFGTSAPAAQAAVDAALLAWQNVITSFNRSDGTSTLQVSITMAKDGMGNFVGGFGGAGGPASTAPADGKPRTGSITINAGTIDGDPNNSNGWYIDPTPNDYTEFQGTIKAPFTAAATSNVGSDLYTVISAEVTHCLGLISPKPGSSGFSGYRLVDSGYTHATSVRDTAEGGGTSGYFYTFNGLSLNHLMTSYNSGDPDDDSWGNVIHTAGGTGNVSISGVPYHGTEDDGNAAGGGNERDLPSWVTANIFKDAYGYSIENPAKFGTMMAVLNRTTGQLHVRGIDNSADNIYVGSSGGKVTVSVKLGTDFPGSGFRPGAGNLDPWVSEFNASAVQSVVIDAGSGDDTITVDQLGGAPVTVNGQNGSDLLVIKGSTGDDGFNVNNPTITGTNVNVQSYSSIEKLRIDTLTGRADLYLANTGSVPVQVNGDSGNETMYLHELGTNSPLTFFTGFGADTVGVEVDPGANLIRSAVTINNAAGNDIVNVAAFPGAAVISVPITFNGAADADTLNLTSGNLDALAGLITFNGGGGFEDKAILNDQATTSPYGYNLTPTSITRDGAFLGMAYVDIDRIVLNCGSGDNNVSVIVGASPLLEAHGNNGIDTFTFNDSVGTTNRTWDIHPNLVIVSGVVTQTNEFEGVGILAGNGADQITISEAMQQSLNIDAGGGADSFTVGYLSQAKFLAPVTLNGGLGNDTYVWKNGSENWYTFLFGDETFPVAIDGGGGFNSLSVDDTTRGNTSYQLFANRFFAREPNGFPEGADFAFHNIGALGLTCSNGANNIAVFGVSPDIASGNQITIACNGGTDAVTVVPHDAAGNSTIAQNIGIVGGPGTDVIAIDDSAQTAAHTYAFGNPFGSGTQDLFFDGAAVGLGYTSDFENATVTGGSGNDTFGVNQYTSNVPLAIYAGNGNDTLNLGGNNLPFNIIMPSGSFLFDGQGGFDRFNLNNTTEISQWTYNTNSGNVQATRGAPVGGYDKLFHGANNEEMTVNAGPAADTFQAVGANPGTHTILNGRGGVDTLQTGLSGVVQGFVQGAITFDAGSVAEFGTLGGGTFSISAASNTNPIQVHLEANKLGAHDGDNFFGAGGSLEFLNCTSGTLTLGSGADTVFAQPNATATISIAGGNPAAAPGDTINLALAAAQNPVQHGSAANGNVTSDNLKTLSYTAFETGPNVDDSAPAVVSLDLNIGGNGRGTPPQSINVTFSEDVAGVDSSALILLNTTTGQQVPATDVSVSYDATTFIATFTFPNYAGGLLPDGVYQAQVLGAGITDVFGNALAEDSSVQSFIWSAGTIGDDVYRLTLDPDTLDYQVYLNDEVTPAFVAAQGTSLIALGGGAGDDSLLVDQTNGNAITPGGVKFNGGEGNDALNVKTRADSADSAAFDAAAVTMNGAVVGHQNVEAFSYDGGLGEYDTLAVAGVAVSLPSSTRFEALSIADNSSALLSGAGDSVLVTRNLSIAPSGFLDLRDNDLILDYTPARRGRGGTPLQMIQNLINLGRNGGAWANAGITSGVAAANDQHNTTLGAMEAADFLSIYGAAAPFDGEAIDDTAVLVKYTYYGDSDFNGKVNFDDYVRTDNGFNNHQSGWTNGDFDGNNAVNFDDYVLIDLAFNTQSGTLRR
jgi:hypothetical protein